MSKEKFYCKRCGKELVSGGYLSQVDHNLICIYCDNKEQPKELIKQIADLEAKLAEKRQDCVALDKAWNNLNNQLSIKNDEINELKQQLAEKEKEIEELKQRLKDTIKIYSDDFVEKDKELKELRFQARNIFPLVENLEDKVNKDKISFCIEQLEKVKELINNKLEFMWQNNAEMTCRDRHIIEKCYEDIDELITEIKEKK